MKTIAIYNVKGGVGKTACAVNMAYFAAASGHQTLLWDLDSQGASSWYLHGEPAHVKTEKVLEGKTPVGRLLKPTPYPNLNIIPADYSYRYLDVIIKQVKPAGKALSKLLAPFSENHALTVLDCPPSLSHLADNVFNAADLILVPVVPTWLSLRAFEQLRGHFKAQGFPSRKLRPFFSMADRRRALHKELLDSPPPAMKHMLKGIVPYASSVERMGEHRAPLVAFSPASDPALTAYAQLWLETAEALGM